MEHLTKETLARLVDERPVYEFFVNDFFLLINFFFDLIRIDIPCIRFNINWNRFSALI